MVRGQPVIGAIALADIVRPESFEAIRRLKAMGVQCIMLTGDAEAVARTVTVSAKLAGRSNPTQG